jgi:hypothetical protein
LPTGGGSASRRDRVLVVAQGVRVVDGAVVVHLASASGRPVVGEHAGGADPQGEAAAAGVGEPAGLAAGEDDHAGGLVGHDVAEADLDPGPALEDPLVETADVVGPAEDPAERVVELDQRIPPSGLLSWTSGSPTQTRRNASRSRWLKAW